MVQSLPRAEQCGAGGDGKLRTFPSLRLWSSASATSNEDAWKAIQHQTKRKQQRWLG
jgi:hypothetical protein